MDLVCPLASQAILPFEEFVHNFTPSDDLSVLIMASSVLYNLPRLINCLKIIATTYWHNKWSATRRNLLSLLEVFEAYASDSILAFGGLLSS